MVNYFVHLYYVHTTWVSRRSSDNGCGTGIGDCCICGALDRRLSYFKSFAMPAICTKESVKLLCLIRKR